MLLCSSFFGVGRIYSSGLKLWVHLFGVGTTGNTTCGRSSLCYEHPPISYDLHLHILHQLYRTHAPRLHRLAAYRICSCFCRIGDTRLGLSSVRRSHILSSYLCTCCLCIATRHFFLSTHVYFGTLEASFVPCPCHIQRNVGQP